MSRSPLFTPLAVDSTTASVDEWRAVGEREVVAGVKATAVDSRPMERRCWTTFMLRFL